MSDTFNMKYLRDENNEIFSPITSASSVYKTYYSFGEATSSEPELLPANSYKLESYSLDTDILSKYVDTNLFNVSANNKFYQATYCGNCLAHILLRMCTQIDGSSWTNYQFDTNVIAIIPHVFRGSAQNILGGLGTVYDNYNDMGYFRLSVVDSYTYIYTTSYTKSKISSRYLDTT